MLQQPKNAIIAFASQIHCSVGYMVINGRYQLNDPPHATENLSPVTKYPSFATTYYSSHAINNSSYATKDPSLVTKYPTHAKSKKIISSPRFW